jgi:hypothetical protein
VGGRSGPVIIGDKLFGFINNRSVTGVVCTRFIVFSQDTSMKYTLLVIVAATAASGAWAQQQPYATIKSVEGLVTVTSGNQLTNATSNMPLQQGAQVLSTSSGKATVQFASGCTAVIQGGQSLQVQETACTAFVASNPAPAAGGMSTPTKWLLGAAGLGLLYDQTRGNGNGNGAVVVLPVTPGPPTVTTPPQAANPRPVSGS